MSEWTSDSNEALKIHLVRAGDDEAMLSPSERSLTKPFHPRFTYPIFGEEEKIYGYEDLSINLFMASGSLKQFVTVEFSERLTGKAIDDPENTLYQYLSDDRLDSLERFAKEVEKDATTFKPIGDKIDSYVRKRGGGKPANRDPREIAIGQMKRTDDDRPKKIDEEDEDVVVYEVYHANFKRHDGFVEFHRRMQIFILLYIEAGSYIEEDDDKWEFVTLFEKRKRKDGKEVYHFIGYSSLYPFYFYPESTRLRLSQFVILGPYQKQGHGAALYKAIHNFVLRSPRFAELTVEDPSEDFEDLRDKVDMRTLLAHQEFIREAYGATGPNGMLTVSRRGTAKRSSIGKENDAGNPSKHERSGTRASKIAMLGPPTKPKWAERWRKELKFAKRQYERLVEMLILRALDENDEAAQRAFRLQVKARLKTFNFETLMQLEQEEQFDKLEETFQSVKEGYERILGMLKKKEGMHSV